MIKACVPEYFCDSDDILLLEEIGREVTGQDRPRHSISSSVNEEVSVCLMEVRGAFRNRLSRNRRCSLEGVRLVVAILKDSEIITASGPSDPLICRRFENEATTRFEARWSDQRGILSFDHSPDDFLPYNLVVALVNENQTSEDFLLACPCGQSVLKLSQRRNGDRRELEIFGNPSPRHYVLFPAFDSPKQTQNSSNNDLELRIDSLEEKKYESSTNDISELPYWSLEKASINIDVSRKQKELDIEVCYAGENAVQLDCMANCDDHQRQILVGAQEGGYTPVRVHRFETEQSLVSKPSSDDNTRGEESPISVVVGDYESLARQQHLPIRVYPNISSTKQATGSTLLDSVMRVLGDELEDEAIKDSSTRSPLPRLSPKQRPASELTLSPTRGEVVRAVSEDNFTTKHARNWSNVFRKPRSVASPANTATHLRRPDESGLEEGMQAINARRGVEKAHSNSRKRLFSGFRSKSNDRKREIEEGKSPEEEPEEESTLLASVGATETIRAVDEAITNFEDGDEVSMLSIPKELLDSAPNLSRSADEDTVGAIRLLNSFCSHGHEVLPPVEDDEASIQEGIPQHQETVARREISTDSKKSRETSVTWVSHESSTPVTRERKSFAKMISGALITPPVLCTNASNVSLDKSFEQKRYNERNRIFEHVRSLDESLSKFSNKTDEITTLSKIEDRMLMKAYHACGGQHLDNVTDIMLRNSPGLIQRWLDTPRSDGYSTEISRLSLADVDFERATTVASQGLSRQLTTITEESESRGRCSSTDTPSPRDTSVKAKGGKEDVLRLATSQESEDWFCTTASF